MYKQALTACPACGSTMLLEHDAEQLETGEDAAEACEALDFEDGMSGANESSVMESANQGLTSVTRASRMFEKISTLDRSPSKVKTRKLSNQYIHVSFLLFFLLSR